MLNDREMADCARDILRLGRVSNHGFGSPFFMNPAWDILLALHRAEAPKPLSYLVRETGNLAILLTRWLKALRTAGIIVASQQEAGTDYALTEASRARLSRVLSTMASVDTGSFTPSRFGPGKAKSADAA